MMQFSQNPLSGIPTVVKNLLIINVIFFLIKVSGFGDFGGDSMDTWFGLHFFTSPLFQPWQLITHMFMHGGWLHIGLNMFGLYMFGPPLEYRWGAKKFLIFYMIAGVGAALFYSGAHAFEYMRMLDYMSPEAVAEVKSMGAEALVHGQNFVDADMAQLNLLMNTSMVGASGALYGILLAFGLTFPNVELIMFPLPIPIKARYFVWIFAGISVYSAIQNNPGDNVAHLAHLGGMVVGFILLKIWGDGPKQAF
ncbi:MAG: rhomboid family intramembrane serine protease [Flavobacteriales bacterium]|nr:rhomboid family intramembrane serine protease [Flavobacteriales bacterium]HQV51418.1 rhomboid family intramembrane serine protease [Flavobacteriales bacterium]HQX28833.1 rhomboid family intramembrane serine protease [Flavobacteriales bacterium]HQX37668.1 rhomboid family intramembrane serine protease [Flavobacteriales bacterium]HQZ92919.1 rhomboid family intramembrane serine protease [Flavobacteriales bacterium]